MPIYLTWDSFLKEQTKLRNIINATITHAFTHTNHTLLDKACISYVEYLIALKTVFLEFRQESREADPGSKKTNYETQYPADECLLDLISEVVPGLKEKEDGQVLNIHFLKNSLEEKQVSTAWESEQKRQNIFLLIHKSEENTWSLFYEDKEKTISLLPPEFKKKLQSFQNQEQIRYKKTSLLQELMASLKREFAPSTWIEFVPEKPDLNISRFVDIQKKLAEHLQLILNEYHYPSKFFQYFFSYPFLYHAVLNICEGYANIPAQIIESPEVQKLYVSRLEELHNAIKPPESFASSCAQALAQQTLQPTLQPVSAPMNIPAQKSLGFSVVNHSASFYSQHQHTQKEEMPHHSNHQQFLSL